MKINFVQDDHPYWPPSKRTESKNDRKQQQNALHRPTDRLKQLQQSYEKYGDGKLDEKKKR